MIYRILLAMTGDWGRPLLDLYGHNSAWINALILAYGVWIWLSWRNLRTIREALLESVIPQVASLNASQDKVVKRIKIPWEEAAQKGRFPFIAHEWAFFPRKNTLEMLKKLVTPESLVAEAEKKLARKNPKPS